MFLAYLPLEYTFHTLFILQKYVLMLMNLILEIHFGLSSYKNTYIDTITSVKFF